MPSTTFEARTSPERSPAMRAGSVRVRVRLRAGRPVPEQPSRTLQRRSSPVQPPLQAFRPVGGLRSPFLERLAQHVHGGVGQLLGQNAHATGELRQPVLPGHQAGGRSTATTSRSPLANSARRSFLSNLPTLVFGTSSTK